MPFDRDNLPDHVLDEAWDGEGDILGIIQQELPRLRQELGDDAERTLRYAGLMEASTRGVDTADHTT